MSQGPWLQDPFHWSLMSHMKEFLLPCPLSLCLREESVDSKLGPPPPSQTAASQGRLCWEQEETSLKLTSMNRPRSEGVRATRVRVTEMGVVPAAVSPQTLRAAGLD